MSDRTKNNRDGDLNQDVSQLADTLDDLLKSSAGNSKEALDGARSRAETLLKETRARLQGGGRFSQAAKNAGVQVNSYVRDKPWHGIGIGTAFGIFIGALIATTSTLRR